VTVLGHVRIGSLVNKGLLEGMRLFRSSQSFEGSDFLLLRCFYRHDIRSHHLAPHHNCARSALCHPAPKSRTPQTQLIAENKQKWHVRVHVNGVALPVYFQLDRLHRPDNAPWRR